MAHERLGAPSSREVAAFRTAASNFVHRGGWHRGLLGDAPATPRPLDWKKYWCLSLEI